MVNINKIKTIINHVEELESITKLLIEAIGTDDLVLKNGLISTTICYSNDQITLLEKELNTLLEMI